MILTTGVVRSIFYTGNTAFVNFVSPQNRAEKNSVLQGG